MGGKSSRDSRVPLLLPSVNVGDDPRNDDVVLRRAEDGLPRSVQAEEHPAHASGSSLRRRPWYRSLTSSTATRKSPRFLDRRGMFQQSRGSLNMRRVIPTAAVASLRVRDWFHTLLAMSSVKIGIVLLLVYIACVLIWAFLYQAASSACNLQIHSFTDAFMLSIETLSTIGFGVPNPYFEGCLAGPFLVLSQSAAGLVLDALCIGVIFARISRGNRRSFTVVFSDKAIIRKIGEHWYFLFQVCDLKKHALVEAHVRMYAVRHRRVPGAGTQSRLPSSDTMGQPASHVWFQTHAMRTTHPNDEIGGMLLLSLPDQVVHRIDAWSPLMPHRMRMPGEQHDPSTSFLFPEPVLRAVDVDNGGREKKNQEKHWPITQEMLEEKFRQDSIEILCLVEGIDAATSYTVQARHSYTLEDIVFEQQFAPCVFRDAKGACVLDLGRFHDRLPLESGHDLEDQVSSIL